MGWQVVSAGLIGVVTFLYAWTALSFWVDGRPGMSIAFVGYSLANIGLIWEALK